MRCSMSDSNALDMGDRARLGRGRSISSTASEVSRVCLTNIPPLRGRDGRLPDASAVFGAVPRGANPLSGSFMVSGGQC